MKPTEAAYTELQEAFDHYNAALFDGALPHCLITLQREKRSYGYFSHERFATQDGRKTDEIAMNPAFFAVTSVEEIMQTLVHEMVHLWQFHFGTPGRMRYHNKEWAEKMEALGLMPSSTGKPGGARTGESMGDYPISGGLFEKATQSLLTRDFRITWMDRFPVLKAGEALPAFLGGQDEGEGEGGGGAPVRENKSNRLKYTCSPCEINVWGKPGLKLICGECNGPFSVADQAGVPAAPSRLRMMA